MDIEDLRMICHKNQSVTEDIKWGNDLCFLVAKKMFCVCGLEQPLTVSFKVKEEEFEDLVAKPGIIPAPYMARYYWINVSDLNVFTKKEWQHYIRQSYTLIKEKLSKKLRGEFGL